jgi:hypothetical protein
MEQRTIDEIKFLLGQADLVFIAAKGTHEGEPCLYIDLYRVEDEKIVEHGASLKWFHPNGNGGTRTACFRENLGGLLNEVR